MAETKKFVDLSGLDYFWGKVEPIITDGDAAVKTHAENKATEALNNAKTYVDNKVDGKFDTVGSAAQALADAKTYFNNENAKDATRMLGIESDVTALETTVGDTTSGLVKEVAALRTEMNALGGVDGGGIGGMIDAKIGALDVEDTAVAGEYVSSVSEVDGKITVTRVALPDYTAAFADKADASALNTHTGDAVAHITADERAAWNTAEQNAKDYADGKFQVKGSYETAGEAAKVQGNLDSHDADTVKHITAAERIAWNSAKDSIDAFLKDADMTEKAVDTLAELQTYMTTDGEAAAKVVERIAKLEAIDHKAYEAADTALETSLKSYADQAEADALTAAKTYADGLIMTDGVAKFEAAGAAATAKSEAIAAAATDATSKADAAKEAAQSYADGLASNYDAAGAASAAETAAKKYTDDTIAAFEFASEEDINAIFNA